MKVITWETLYYEDHGATLKHKCGKRIVTLSLLSFSLFFWAFFFSLVFLFFWDNALLNDDNHTFIYLQLNDYNLILKQSMTYMDASGGVPGYAMNQEWQVWRNNERWLCHKYYVNYMIMLSNMTMMNVSWWTEWWKVAWKYISEWLWKCHNR